MKKILTGLLLLLAFVGCSNSSLKKFIGANDTFIGKEYVLQGEYKDYNITINFAEENFMGFAGVNNYFGRYTVKDNMITLDHIGRTMMMGPMDKMDAEDDFVEDLDDVKTFEISGDKLILTTEDGDVLEFKASGKASPKN